GAAAVIQSPLSTSVKAKAFAITIEPESGILSANLTAHHDGDQELSRDAQPPPRCSRPNPAMPLEQIRITAKSEPISPYRRSLAKSPLQRCYGNSSGSGLN